MGYIRDPALGTEHLPTSGMRASLSRPKGNQDNMVL